MIHLDNINYYDLQIYQTEKDKLSLYLILCNFIKRDSDCQKNMASYNFKDKYLQINKICHKNSTTLIFQIP